MPLIEFFDFACYSSLSDKRINDVSSVSCRKIMIYEAACKDRGVAARGRNGGVVGRSGRNT